MLLLCRDIDDIVLSYVQGILDDVLEETDPEQSFDSDSFMEMIVAYLPQLEGIEEAKVTDWMMNLVKSIQDTKKEKASASFDIKMLIEETANKPSVKKTRSVSETSSEPETTNKKRIGRLSETSEVTIIFQLKSVSHTTIMTC